MARILRGDIYWADMSLPKKSWVKISQVRTLSILRLREKIGEVPIENLDTIIEGLNEIIG